MGYGVSVSVSCGIGHRCSSDLALLWLRHRLAAAALTRSLAWELPYASDMAKEGREGGRNEGRKGKNWKLATRFYCPKSHLSDKLKKNHRVTVLYLG